MEEDKQINELPIQVPDVKPKRKPRKPRKPRKKAIKPDNKGEEVEEKKQDDIKVKKTKSSKPKPKAKSVDRPILTVLFDKKVEYLNKRISTCKDGKKVESYKMMIKKLEKKPKL